MDKLIITNDDLRRIVSGICRSISTSNWRPDYIVGITRGGLVPAVMISHWFNVPMHTLNVSLRDSTTGPESNLWMAEDAFGYNSEPKNILIVDDINDSGATMNWIMDDWRASCFPQGERWDKTWNNNVRFAVLVDNSASDCSVAMDYIGMSVNKAEKDVWIEFPYENWWA